MTTTIEVTAIRPPKEGKKVATVVDNTGRSFQCFPDKLAKWGLKEGSRFEIEVEERTWQDRTYRNITKAKEVMPNDDRQIMPGNGNPVARPPSATVADQVWAAFCAFAAAGKVECDGQTIGQVIRTLQLAHSHVFGNLGTFRASDASRSWGTQQ
jgi:hypothetical protein